MLLMLPSMIHLHRNAWRRSLALAILLAGCGGGSSGTQTAGTTTTSPAAVSTTTDTAAGGAQAVEPAAECNALTTGTTEGPYYVTGTAELADGNLNYDNLSGDVIRIVGHVYGGVDTTMPLADAVIDIWQADDAGSYWPQANGPASNYSANQLSLRGHVKSDASGYFEFTTIYPGEYEGRARHIHIRATSAGGEQDVITQLIMSKDGDQTPASQDIIAHSLPSCNTMKLVSVDGVDTAVFDFHI